MKCNIDKPLSDYYKCEKMKDGHFNKCKSCFKKDVRSNRKANVERYRDYDKKRGNRQSDDYMEKYRKKYPNKYKAHNMVSNAIRDNKLFREPCENCDDKKTHAHHDDYLKPLNVRWLCPAHHKEWHVKNGEALNP